MKLEAGTEPELVVYETPDVEYSSEDEKIEERTNEEIETSLLTHEAALEAFAEPARRRDETVATRVARIRREIEALRRDGAEFEAADILNDLRSSVSHRTRKCAPRLEDVPARPEPLALGTDASPQFAALESRVATLEEKFGLSLRSPRAPESLAGSVAQLKRTVELLASNPESIAPLLERISGSQPNKPRRVELTREARVDILFNRLGALDEAVNVIPQVVSRLQTLRYFHTDTLAKQQQLNDIAATLESMKGELQSWKAVLEALEKRIQRNESMN